MTETKIPDPTLRSLLGETWLLLRTHPGLWTPPLLLNLLLAMLAGNGTSGLAIALPMICAWLLSIAFRAGWFEQMMRVVRGEPAAPARRPTWGQFLEGVGHYFWRFLGGELAQLILLGLGLVVVAAYGSQTVGFPSQTMLNQVMDAARKSGFSLSQLPAGTIRTLDAWTMLLVGWGGYWAVLAFLLLFWPALCVWRDKSWPQAWRDSLQMVGRHLRVVLTLVILEAATYVIVFQMVASGATILMMIGYAAYVLAWTYFTLILFLALQRWDDHAPAPPAHP